MRSNVLIRATVCLCAMLLCGVLGVAAVSKSSPSAGVSKPSFDLTLQGGVYSLSARDAALNEILEQLAALSGVQFQIDPNLKEKVTLDLNGATLEDLVKSLTKSQAMIYQRDGDRFKLVQASVTSQQKEITPAVAKPVVERTAEEEARLKARGILTNSRRTTHDLLQRDSKSILLQNAMIDTEVAHATGKSVDVPAEFKAPEDTSYFIVQFDHPVSSRDQAALENAGATVSHYVPNYAYAVHATPAQLAAIKALAGVIFVEPYHPYYKMSTAVLSYLTGMPDKQTKESVTNGVFNVMTFRGAQAKSGLESMGAEILREETTDGRTVLTVRADPDLLKSMMKLDGIQWVEPKVFSKPMNDLGTKRIRGPSLKSLHPSLTGEGVIVNVTDTGIDYINPGFSLIQTQPTSTNLNTRIAYYEARPGPFTEGLPGDANGHGTHVSGSILGNGALSATVVKSPGSGSAPYATNQFAGVAPGAKVVMLEDFNSFTDEEQAQIAYARGARISNNSWGNSVYEYGTMSATWDALVRDADNTPGVGDDKGYIVFFAAGNDGNGNRKGTGGTPGTIGQPGNSKNVITVGAVEQPRFADNLLDIYVTSGTNAEYRVNSRERTDTDWQVAEFSSRGPVTATDKRVKPDVVAPGCYVLSIQTHEAVFDDLRESPYIGDYRYGNVDSGTNFAFFNGTSMATPLAAGGAALIYQYYTNTYSRAPSPAMMKAMMVNGAGMLNTLVYRYPMSDNDVTIVDQGWGMLNVVRSVDGMRVHPSDTVTCLDADQTGSLITGQWYTRQVQVAPGEGGLKITLAWTDSPGTPGNAIQLVNDIDLVVYAPGGGGYVGNEFSYDGVHSLKFDNPSPSYGDEFNNVENVVISDALPGTYTVKVYGWNVPQGEQDFALVIMKGSGIEGRSAGSSPDVALDTNDAPVIAYSQDVTPSEGTLRRQIMVKRWAGPVGDLSDLGTWKRLDDQWYEIRDSVSASGIDMTLENSDEPSIAVGGQNVYVAWTEQPRPPETVSHIFMKQFNGLDWIELANSGRGAGVGGLSSYNATKPVVRVGADGFPVVAWKRTLADASGERVFVARWNGTSWVGFAGSHTNGVPSSGGSFGMVGTPCMVIDSSGMPVVAWDDTTLQRIQVRRWDGASWVDLGNQGLAPFADSPTLAAGPAGTLYLAWVQLYGANPLPYLSQQVYASRYSGGWSAIGNSQTFPGISASSNLFPSSPSVGVSPNGTVFVTWQAGATNENSILARKFDGATWIGVGGSESQPGITLPGGISRYPVIVVDKVNLPTVVFQNAWDPEDMTNTEIVAYALIGDREPPDFAGLQRAVGGTNNNVVLTWTNATDNISSTIVYRVYRGTNWWSCGSTPACSESDVFANLVGTVTNVLRFNMTGLTPNRTYCFGVRAGDTNGLFDDNTVVLSAAAVSGTGDADADCLSNATELVAGTDACNPDTDGDGMKDGWEWFYSTNNPAHTNALAMDPLDNGAINYRNFDMGNTNQLPASDLDGDGASNFEEYQWYVAHGTNCAFGNANNPDPTRSDTDGDGMSDGWEMINGFNPVNPADAGGDPDGDGLSNLQEYQWGSDPRTPDSDSDGLLDGNEVTNFLTNPSMPDTDLDGLDDSQEIAGGSNPRNADSLGHGISDGDMFQLGWNVTNGNDVLNTLLKETFETSSRTNWTHRPVNAAFPYDLWHVSLAEPMPNNRGVNSNVVYMYDHTTNTVYAYSTDVALGTNWAAGYNRGQQLAALESPRISALVVSNLFVSWNEYYATEPNADFVQVFGRSGVNTNWYPVSAALSGVSGVSNALTNTVGIWTHRVLDISRFAGQSNVQVRFLFTANNVNNYFPGWYVDDVLVYEGSGGIRGWVRDNNGAPIEGALVQVLGRGNITNYVQGNKVVLPGKIFGEAKTADDGSYVITGLPLGKFYVKASEASHQSEFWNGTLFTAPYGFGRQLNPGVLSIDLATNGWLDLTATGSVGACHFELEPGKGRTYLGVMFQGSNPSNICYINGLTTNQQARIWNGVANSNLINFTTYRASTNSSLAINHPDWLLNAVQPALLGDLAVGRQVVYVGSNLAFYAPPVVDLREGEVTLVNVGTNSGKGFLDVVAGDNGQYPVLVDARGITNRTPLRLSVLAGTHEVRLVPTNSLAVAPKIVYVPIGSRAVVVFSSNDIWGVGGATAIATRDNNGNVITGASIYVDGVLYGAGTTNAAVTPLTVTGLKPGEHDLTVRMSGYRQPELRRASVFSNVTNVETFVLYDADEDYDLVGDRTEIIGYTNIFKYQRDDDPDSDGLVNLFEFEQFRLFGIRLNPFDPDTDHDRMPDGAELGYDGITNLLALSTLETNVVQGTPVVRAYFVGQFLAGICNFGSGNRAVSIEGDRFECSAVSNTCAAVPTKDKAVTLFLGIPTNVTSRSVSYGHNKGALVYADGLPDRVDTDEDGMWDGFEFLGGLGTIAKLDVIEAGRTEEDPDSDGLINYEEFLGRDWTANTNDWTDPTNPDTDGDDMPDGWEMSHGFDPLNRADAFEDADADGLQNVSEFFAGTNPKLADTDADFLPDGAEVITYGTDPLDIDTDYDGLLDGREVWDRNLDGIRDGGFFPMWAGGDLDGDGYVDGPTDWDTDGDGMPDGWEVIDDFGNLRNDPRLDPYNPYDGGDDPDGDGLSNLQEYLVRDSLYGNNTSGAVWDYSSDPFNPDSDGDGMPDGWEVMFGLHPMDPISIDEGVETTRYGSLSPDGDPDGDGLWNGREFAIRFHLNPAALPYAIDSLSTDPHNPDTDRDGLADGEEDRAFRTHPILQDSDGDRLTDGFGVTNRWGEVESELRVSDYQVLACTNCTVPQAALLASQATYQGNPGIAGRLASIISQRDQDKITPLLGAVTLAAVGAENAEGVDPENGWEWMSGVVFGYTNWDVGQPALVNTGDVHYIALDNAGAWTVIADTQTMDHYVVEYPRALPAQTNHYDQALNDLWELSWPATEDLPSWQKVEVDTNSPLPAPRWGQAMTYIPVFETKTPRDDSTDNGATILLDNRQIVIFGGRDGVTRHRDVWEYIVRSNMWVKSVAPMDGLLPGYSEGLSEFSAISILGYKNTKAGACPCDNYNCSGDEFGLPKDRPWSETANGGVSRSFDWTYVFSGWDDQHAYGLGYWFYKSTDDPRPITDTTAGNAAKGVTEYIDMFVTNDALQATSQKDGSVETFLIGNPPCCRELGSGHHVDDATGFSAIQFGNFALDSDCDQLVSAFLVLDIEGSPSAVVTSRVTAEITYALKHSDPEYQSKLDTREPSRRVSNPSTYFNSTSVVFAIPPGVSAVTVDVTRLVQEIISIDWDSTTIGFVFEATNNLQYAVVRPDLSSIRATYIPSYKIEPYWRPPNSITYVNTPDQLGRKSIAMAYDYDRQRVVMFGGLDGRRVRGDSREATITFTGDFNPDNLMWTEIRTAKSPAPRWGHSMTYDHKNKRTMLFGGFDENHRPLNDLWYYEQTTFTETTTNVTEGVTNIATVTYTNAAEWTEITEFRNTERPQPRGGAMLMYYGDYDYNRAIADYCVGGNHQEIVLFGGTDGNVYFNDTWVFDSGKNRWILVNPVGEQSQSPTPRAFASMVWAQNGRGAPDPTGWSDYTADETPPCTIPCIYLFGGRTGPLPTGEDTDSDWVPDGAEHELGGPAAGRDPRVNALVNPNYIVVTNVVGTNTVVMTNTLETIPFAYQRIGSIPRLRDFNAALTSNRAAIANMESLRNDDGVYASVYGLPYEIWPEPDAVVETIEGQSEIGVDADRADLPHLWYHRSGGENPYDVRDVWYRGCPNSAGVGSNVVPRYAHSGRWCYGTSLHSTYPNDAIMELYSPIMDLRIPPPNATSTNNMNNYFLVFHEWLDLFDSNDVVRVEAVRPETPTDISRRRTGMNKPVLPVLPNRNGTFNTHGNWRRIVVPLDTLANESNVFLRFTLQSDSSGVAGGWYIDDVAVLQASEISGTFTNMPGVDVVLYGENYNGHIYDTTFTDGNGLFMFGFLPLGNYMFGSVSSIFGPIALTDTNSSYSVAGTNLEDVVFTDITGMPRVIEWPAVPGVKYRLQYSYSIFGPWLDLADVVASGAIGNYSDWSGDSARYYRIWVLSTQ